MRPATGTSGQTPTQGQSPSATDGSNMASTHARSFSPFAESTIDPSTIVLPQFPKAPAPLHQRAHEHDRLTMHLPTGSSPNPKPSGWWGATATNYWQGSHLASRRSSFNTADKGTRTATRSWSAVYDRPRTEDPFIIHRRSVQFFPPSGARRLPFSAEPPSPTEFYRSSHSRSTSIPSVNDTPNALPQYTNYVPAPAIDWTLPSTRLREYRKIDSSCRGLRGLWRRIAPGWCPCERRLGFFDENDSDTGSVRRYRVELPRILDEKNQGNAIACDPQTRIDASPRKSYRSCLALWKGLLGRKSRVGD